MYFIWLWILYQCQIKYELFRNYCQIMKSLKPCHKTLLCNPWSALVRVVQSEVYHGCKRDISPYKVFSHQRSSYIWGHLPFKDVFHWRSSSLQIWSSIEVYLSWKVIFHQRSSSSEDCIFSPHNVFSDTLTFYSLAEKFQLHWIFFTQIKFNFLLCHNCGGYLRMKIPHLTHWQSSNEIKLRIILAKLRLAPA